MKRILLNWNSCGGGGSSVPAPTPPWSRPITSPNTNSIYGNGQINLICDTTYLSSNQTQTISGQPQPYTVVLPNGNYARQIIRIYLDPNFVNSQSSAPFNLTGSFLGFTSLTFNNTGFSAVLEWVPSSGGGGAWSLIGGNANVNPS